jgi:hypothetical protein
MAATSELTDLHRCIAGLRAALDPVRSRYGDTRAVRRLADDVERLSLDASELDDVAPPPTPAAVGTMEVIDDTPLDPALWRDADDEGLGGYHGGGR